MQSVQLTLISFHKNQKWWAFKQMRLAHKTIVSQHAPTFYKLLGSGAGQGFSILPNLSNYALLTVFSNPAEEEAFWRENPFALELKERSSLCKISLTPLSGKGSWSGKQPFETTKIPSDENQMVAVITRASIKKRFWPIFWTMVPSVAKQILKQTGLRFAIGVGELPLIELATFTIWDSTIKMQQAAYNQPDHKKAVERTRKLNWFSEEMFFRFSVVRLKFHGEIPEHWKELSQIDKHTLSN